MYYKLTMKDKRVVFITEKNLEESICRSAGVSGKRVTWGTSFEVRLGQINFSFPDCVDWEMIEMEDSHVSGNPHRAVR